MGRKGWKTAVTLAVLAGILLRCFIQNRENRLPLILEPVLEAEIHEPMAGGAGACHDAG